MEINLRQKLSQQQKMVLTQKMQQSIKILQMPINELRDYIYKEFEENPVLDLKKDFIEKKENNNENLKEYDYKEIVKYFEFDNYGSQSYENYEDAVSPFNFISEKKSLKIFLHEQISESSNDEIIGEIAHYLVENLDHRGYLEIDIEEISKELNIDIVTVEKALGFFQNLEPCGIGARDIKECICIQLRHLNIDNDILFDIVENYLEDIAENRYKNIAKNYKISEKEVQKYSDIIKKLEPKPSRGFFTGEDVKFIMPDAEIKEFNGEFYIIMNDRLLPKLTINNMYKTIIANNDKNNVTRYVQDKIDNALFLIKSIEQRKKTLRKVLEKIIIKQKPFLKHGTSYIKPMTLKEISEEIGMHESTVSRAIKNKYVLTSFGTIKIRDLFITGLTRDNAEEEVSVVQIKNKIKELIDLEDRKKPMSDQVISKILNEQNMNISRRTVAKYREAMGIKASSKRKRI
ncbi:MAG: RNA polymerase factor sigma-54 [Clostridiaceae bacterium]|nr:RNA polymerase factor sigma-54 [Clostridiaceae bacterium]